VAEVVNKRSERIDHAFELLLVLSSIVAAALYEHTGVEPIDLPPILKSIPAALNFLFLPFIILIPLWIYLLITTNQKIQTALRIYLWSLIVFHLLLLVMEFIVMSRLGSEYIPLFGILFIFALIVPILPGLVVWYIISSYGDSLPRLRFSRILKPLLFLIAYGTIWVILIIAMLVIASM